MTISDTGPGLPQKAQEYLFQPFQGGVPEGKLFTAAHSAEAMLGTLDDLTGEDSGGLFAYDGTRLPY